MDVNDSLRQLLSLRGRDAGAYLIGNFGSLESLYEILHTSVSQGVKCSQEDLHSKRVKYGDNSGKIKTPRSFMLLFFDNFKRIPVLALLFLSLTLLWLSLSRSIGYKKKGDIFQVLKNNVSAPSSQEFLETQYFWSDYLAVVLITIMSAAVYTMSSYFMEKKFCKCHSSIESFYRAKVLRKGLPSSVLVQEIVVGDICFLSSGDIVPADGVIISGCNLQCEESLPNDEVTVVKKSIGNDPVLLSGSRVVNGSGKMLILAVGRQRLQENDSPKKETTKDLLINFFKSPISALKSKHQNVNRTRENAGNQRSQNIVELEIDEGIFDPSNLHLRPGLIRSPLLVKLGNLSASFGYAGVMTSVIVVAILSTRFVIETFGVKRESWKWIYIEQFLQFAFVGVAIAIIPQNLVHIANLAFANLMNKMLQFRVAIKNLQACETVGRVTSIICDKTGILTSNKLSVVDVFIAGRRFSQASMLDSKSPDGIMNILSSDISDLLVESICMNSLHSPSHISVLNTSLNHPKVDGNRLEAALLSFVLGLLQKPISFSPRGSNIENPIEYIRSRYTENSILKMFHFNRSRKLMATAVERENGDVFLYVKGFSDSVLEKCDSLLTQDGSLNVLSDELRNEISRFVTDPMKSVGLKTICLAYRCFSVREKSLIDWENDDGSIVAGLTCIGIIGLADTLKPNAANTVKKCYSSGITIRMVTQSSLHTAKAIGNICGIATSKNNLVICSKELNKIIRNPVDGVTDVHKFNKAWSELRILSCEYPNDKLDLVELATSCQNEVIAVTGQKPEDDIVLKGAHVGFAPSSASDIAKEASDIIIGTDSLEEIVKAILWGRNIYDTISRFLQFQFTINSVLLPTVVIAAAVLKNTIFAAVHLVFFNLLTDVLAAIAFASEPPRSKSLKKAPKRNPNQSFISATMAKCILFSACYQLAVILVLVLFGEHFVLNSSVHFHTTWMNWPGEATKIFTIIFNFFVLATFTNQLCCRQLNNERNIFEDIHRSKMFCFIWLASLISNVIVVNFGSYAFHTAYLDWREWLWCILFGIVGQLLCYQLTISISLEKIHSFRRWFESGPSPTAMSNLHSLNDESGPISVISLKTLETNF